MCEIPAVGLCVCRCLNMNQPPTNQPHPTPRQQVRCLTPAWHPRVELRTGRVALPLLREWRPVLSLSTVLLGLQLLFIDPTAAADDDQPQPQPHPPPPSSASAASAALPSFPNPLAAAALREDPGRYAQQVARTLAGGEFIGVVFPPQRVCAQPAVVAAVAAAGGVPLPAAGAGSAANGAGVWMGQPPREAWVSPSLARKRKSVERRGGGGGSGSGVGPGGGGGSQAVAAALLECCAAPPEEDLEAMRIDDDDDEDGDGSGGVGADCNVDGEEGGRAGGGGRSKKRLCCAVVGGGGGDGHHKHGPMAPPPPVLLAPPLHLAGSARRAGAAATVPAALFVAGGGGDSSSNGGGLPPPSGAFPPGMLGSPHGEASGLFDFPASSLPRQPAPAGAL